MTMMSLNVSGGIGQEIMKQIHKPQNALMHRKMQTMMLTAVNPLITGLIEEGVSQGLCSTEYPGEVTEMVLLYSNTAFDDLAELSSDERQKKITAFIYNLERLLGMDQGSLNEVILPIFQNS